MDPLVVTVGRLRRRLGFQQWLRYVVFFLSLSFTGCCIFLVLTRLVGVSYLGNWPYLVLPLAGCLFSAVYAWRKWPSPLYAAVQADRRLGLQERLTSSLELAGAEGPMMPALHADARDQVKRVNVAKAFPYTPPPALRWLALPVFLFGIGHLLLPEFDLFGVQQRQAQAKLQEQARRVQAQKIEAAAIPLKAPLELPENTDAAAMAQEIERVAEQLSSGALTDKQALAKLSDLAEQLEKQREALQSMAAVPNLTENLAKTGTAQDMAKNIMNGNFGEAAKKAKELEDKLKDGKLSDDEKKKIAEDMKKLSDLLKGQEAGKQDSKLSEALAKAAAGLQEMNMAGEGTPESLEQAKLDIEDVKSILEQLDKINLAMKELTNCKLDMLGSSDFCRICGTKLKPCQGGKDCKKCGPGYSCYGMCGACGSGWSECGGKGEWKAGLAQKFSNGMGGPGHGQGQSTGSLPDVQDSFTPTVLPGEITKGKFLADIVQRAQPDMGQQPTAEFVQGVVAEAKQEAEQALTKEEIPPASREFVRQYFSTVEQKTSQ